MLSVKRPLEEVGAAISKTTFDSGAVRDIGVAGSKGQECRYDLITPIGLRRLAETYGEGAKKYGDRNWEKGIPTSDLMNHLMAHINQYNAGDRSEDHLAHAAWGLFAIMHFDTLKGTDILEKQFQRRDAQPVAPMKYAGPEC